MRTVEDPDVVVFVGGGVLRGALVAHVCADHGVSVVVVDSASVLDPELEDVATGRGSITSVLVDTVAVADPEVVREVLALGVPVLALRDASTVRCGDLGGVVGFSGWLDVDDDPDRFVAALRAGHGTAPRPRIAATSVVEDLTPREAEVLRELLSGDPTAVIAERLGISEHTVRTHVHNVLGKLGVGSRAQAAVVALEAGVAAPHEAVSA